MLYCRRGAPAAKDLHAGDGVAGWDAARLALQGRQVRRKRKSSLEKTNIIQLKSQIVQWSFHELNGKDYSGQSQENPELTVGRLFPVNLGGKRLHTADLLSS